MMRRLHLLLLHLFALLPGPARTAVVRLVSPPFTVGTDVVMIDPAGRVLLVSQPYTNGWGLPGGLIGRGEEPALTARREIEEELGVDIGALNDAPRAVRAPDRRHLDLVFAVRVDDDIAGTIHANSVEITEARWYDTGSLPDLVEGTEALLSIGLRTLGDGSAGTATIDRPGA